MRLIILMIWQKGSLMINLFIDTINKKFSSLQGGKIYGLAQSMIRVKSDGLESLPAIVDNDGEGKYIGIDNTLPFIIYHKNNSITTRQVAKAGYGDESGDTVNTYSNTMVVYMNRKKLKIQPDQMFLNLQGSFPDSITHQGFKNIVILIQNVILNSQQVWASEYQNTDFRLQPDSNLFAINYTIESTFKKGCFDTCK